MLFSGHALNGPKLIALTLETRGGPIPMAFSDSVSMAPSHLGQVTVVNRPKVPLSLFGSLVIPGRVICSLQMGQVHSAFSMMSAGSRIMNGAFKSHVMAGNVNIGVGRKRTRSMKDMLFKSESKLFSTTT